MQMEAIEHSMEEDGGLLITVHDKEGEKVITVDSKKVGLSEARVFRPLDIGASQASVFSMLNSMKGSYAAVAESIGHEKQEKDVSELAKKDQRALETWNGKE